MKNSNKFIVISFLIISYLVLLLYPINYILVSKGIIKIYNPQASKVSESSGISSKVENIRNNLKPKQ
jgi:LEA14-like dessication related protein